MKNKGYEAEAIETAQRLFKTRFGVELQEKDLYGYLVPRLHRQMDAFLDQQVSDETIVALVDYLSEKLHGKSLLQNKAGPAETPKDAPVLTKKPVKKKPGGSNAG
jgi:hypothetical protein